MAAAGKTILREEDQLNVLQQTKGRYENNLFEDVLLYVLKEEFLQKTCDKQHPRTSRRGLVARDETDEDG